MSKNIPDMIKDFVELDEKYKERKKNLDDIKATLDGMKAAMIEEFIEQGVGKMTAHGRTVYLTNSFQARPVEGTNLQGIAQAMVGSELQGLITVNSRSLTSFVKNEIEHYMVENGLDMADNLDYNKMMPKELQGKLDIGVFTQIASRKG